MTVRHPGSSSTVPARKCAFDALVRGRPCACRGKAVLEEDLPMSETLQAVIITGVVTLAAAMGGQLLAGWTSRSVAREERRLRAAQELRPLAVEALDALNRVVGATNREHETIGELGQRLQENPRLRPYEVGLHDDAEPTTAAAREALERAHRAVLALELSTDDARLSEEIASVRFTLATIRSSTIHYRLDVGDPGAAMVGQDAWTAVMNLERQLPQLTEALQPLTSLLRAGPHPRAWIRRAQARRRIETLRAELHRLEVGG